MVSNQHNSKEDFQVDFIGIGTIKRGATWIFQCLKEHPQICGSSKKEINFFSRPENYKKGLEYYRTFFEHCSSNKIKGEFTPNYLLRLYKKERQENIHSRIHNYFPEVKLIASLRDPVERAYSHYRWSASGKGPLSAHDSFEEVIQEAPRLIEQGFYYKHLEKYFSLFPEENILVLIYEDLKESPVEFIQDIYEFLEVDQQFVPPSADKKMNTSGEKQARWKIPLLGKQMYNLAHQVGHDTKLFHFLKKSGVRNAYKSIMRWNKSLEETEKTKPTTVDSIDSQLRHKLYQIYESDIAQLEKLIGRDLSSWKENDEQS